MNIGESMAKYNKSEGLIKTIGKTRIVTSEGYEVEGNNISFDNKNKTISGQPVTFIMYAECINNNNKEILEIIKITFKFEFILIFFIMLKNSMQHKKETTNNKISQE